MTNTCKILEQEGTLLEVGGKDALLLRDSNSAWLVRSGQIDVFCVDIEDGQPAGPRSHLFRVQAGEVLLGMDLASSGETVGLLAVAGMGTSLLTLPTSRLKQLARDPAHAVAIANWVEKWAGGLLSGLAKGSFHPRAFQELDCGKQVELEDGQSVSTGHRMLWITHSGGSLRLQGREDIPFIKQAHFFPLCDKIWLAASGKVMVRAVDTSTFLNEDVSWAGLDAFHRLALRCIRLDRKQAEEYNRERLDATGEVDRVAVESAYTQLGSVLMPAVRGHVVESEDVLLTACRMVGQAMGIEIRPHPYAKHRAKQADPLADIAKASRIRIRKIFLEHRWWRKDAGPILGYLEETRRPVALLPTSPGKYVLCDPVERTRTPVGSAVAASLDPSGYVFYPTFPDRVISGKDVIRFGLFGCTRDLIRILLMGIAAGLLGFVTPVATGLLFDTVIPEAKLDQLLHIVIALGVSALAIAAFQVIQAFAVLRTEGKMDGAVEAAIWDRLLNLPLPFFRKYTSGDLAIRAMGVSMIRRMLSGPVVSTVLHGTFSALSLVLVFYYSPRLALWALGILLVGAAVSVTCVCIQLRYQRPLYNIQGRIQGMLLEFITGISKLRVAGAEKRAFASWARAFAEQKALSYKSEKVSAGLTVFTTILPVLAAIIIYHRVAFSSSPALMNITAGRFLAFNVAFMNVLSGGIAMISALLPVLMVAPLYERTKPILHALPEVDIHKPPPGELRGRVEASHVSFRYTEEGPMVLKDVCLRVEPGEFVAIVGPSGSGKSTLFRILLGFEFPESGTIYYDAQDIAGIDVQELRRQVGVVLQNSKVMPGTILSNIVGASLLTIDDAWEAARMCGLAGDIKEMPMGMQTVVLEGGEGLSGGQKQRILIARAIANKPRILLFDEATSALDNKTQAIVSDSLEQLKATRIVIAHRLSTIMKADRIFVLVDGRIVERGTYEELMRRKGTFAELAERQLT